MKPEPTFEETPCSVCSCHNPVMSGRGCKHCLFEEALDALLRAKTTDFSETTYARETLRQAHQAATTEAVREVLELPVPYTLRMNGNGSWLAEWNPAVESSDLPPVVQGYSKSNPIHAVERLREKLLEVGVVAKLARLNSEGKL